MTFKTVAVKKLPFFIAISCILFYTLRMKKQQLLEWNYYTPRKGKRMVSLMRYSEWVIIYPREVIYAHVSHEEMLIAAGLERCDGVKVYKTKREALKAKGNLFVKPTE